MALWSEAAARLAISQERVAWRRLRQYCPGVSVSYAIITLVPKEDT